MPNPLLWTAGKRASRFRYDLKDMECKAFEERNRGEFDQAVRGGAPEREHPTDPPREPVDAIKNGYTALFAVVQCLEYTF